MCGKILEAAGKLNIDEYNFFLRGGIVSNHIQTPLKWILVTTIILGVQFRGDPDHQIFLKFGNLVAKILLKSYQS